MSIIVSGITLPTTKGSIKYGGVDIEQVDVVQNGSRTTVWKVDSDGIWENGRWNRNSSHVCTLDYTSSMFGIDPINGYEGFHPNGQNIRAAIIKIKLPKNKGIQSIYIEISRSTLCNLNLDLSKLILKNNNNSNIDFESVYFNTSEKQNVSDTTSFKFTPRHTSSTSLSPVDSYNDPIFQIELWFNIHDWIGIKTIRVLDRNNNIVNIL